jgi:hypothetical protein
MKRGIVTTVACAALTFTTSLHAQSAGGPPLPSQDAGGSVAGSIDAPSPPGPAPPPGPTPPTRAPPAPPPFTPEDAQRARFNVGRFLLEMLVSSVGGTAAGYGAFAGICGSRACLAGALTGLGANFVATPLLAAGTGALLGGRGSVGASFGGTGIALAVGTAFTLGVDADANGLAVGMAMMPVTASLAYELTSDKRARDMRRQLGIAAVEPKVTPIISRGQVVGFWLGVEGTL